MPAWALNSGSTLTDTRFLGNNLLQWAGLLGVLLGGFIVGKVVSFVLLRQSRALQTRQTRPLIAMFLRSISRPVMLLSLAAGLYAASMFMNLTYTTLGSRQVTQDGKTVTETFIQAHSVLEFWLNVCRTLSSLAAAWFVFRMVDVLEFYLKKWTSKTRSALDDQLVPLLRKSLRIFVVIVAALFIAQNIFRMDIGALMAGLGIGGLAFALAAKDMLANLFGSVTIFADRPFTLGERIKVKDYDGTIEEVGFRSSRLRMLNGHLVTIPNAVLASEPIENIARRPFIKRTLEVTVTYDTTPRKLHRAVEIIREMLDARKESFHRDNEPRVFFGDFGATSLNIIVYYWFTPPAWWQYLAFNHEFNMELLRRFNDEGIEFAFPTQTLYVKQDSSLQASADPHNRDDGGHTRSGEAYT